MLTLGVGQSSSDVELATPVDYTTEEVSPFSDRTWCGGGEGGGAGDC